MIGQESGEVMESLIRLRGWEVIRTSGRVTSRKAIRIYPMMI